MTAPRQIRASYLPVCAILEAMRGISKAPGTQEMCIRDRLKYGTLPELEKKLEEEKQKADSVDGGEARLLKEEVNEEEIAEDVYKRQILRR